MQQATAEIATWMGTDDRRYAILTFHSGYGLSPGIRISLYQIERDKDSKLVSRKVVTMKGSVEEAPDKIREALARWAAGDFDVSKLEEGDNYGQFGALDN